jgi:hypothetical protein
MPEGVPKLASGNLLTVSGLEGWGVLAARVKRHRTASLGNTSVTWAIFVSN